jgi:hypothetical protein
MPLSPARVVLSFIECINAGDVQGLGRLMAQDHALKVFDEAPLIGCDANLAAWRGYAESYPDYVIVPHRIAEHGGVVAVLGHTTGSHLGLADEEESRLTLIWVAEVVEAAVRSWTLVEDSPGNRRRFRLDRDG